MKILLLGHEGYLGSRLREYFYEHGHTVVRFGRQQDICTITASTFVEQAVDLAVNCATVANRTDRLYEIDGRDEEVNLFGARQLILALKGTGIGLVHLSTKDVYGEVYAHNQVQEVGSRLVPGFEIDESQPFRPQTIYAKTKLMAEFVVESYAEATTVRLSSGYTSTPHHRGNWILHFCRAAKAGTAVRINGSGKQLRDPLHADDLGALILAIKAKSAWGLKLNAGGGRDSAYSILEVLQMIDPKVNKEFVPGGDLGYVTNNGLAGSVLGWRPKLSFPTELAELIRRVAHE